MTRREQGERDAMWGHGFPSAYETWPRSHQLSYERGRLAQAAKDSRRCMQGKAIERAIALTNGGMRIGLVTR